MFEYYIIFCAKYYTLEFPNKGQVGTLTDVHYSGVVLYWGFQLNTIYSTIGKLTEQNTVKGCHKARGKVNAFWAIETTRQVLLFTPFVP